MDYYIDTHAHIYLEEFDQDREEMLRRCTDARVNEIYMPNVDHTSIDRMMELEAKHPNCKAMMGLHPCYIKKDFEKELYLVESWLNRRVFFAIGEIGTDLYWDKTFWPQQQEAFKIQVGWAKKFKRPIVIHSRDSIDETIQLLEPLLDNSLKGVFHCFSGTFEQADQIIKMGFLLGIGGVATFKNGGLDKVLPDVDLSHLILETDSPYLAPVPHRGKRNEPSYIPLVAKRVAELKNVLIEEVMEQTMENAKQLFKHNA
jgi:TatD DNase family protein